MVMFQSIPAACFTLAALTFAGCTGGGTATNFATSNAAVTSILGGQAEPSAADLALSCAQISARLSRLYARYAEIEAAEKARAKQNAVGGALADMGLAVLGGKMVSNISAMGGLNGLRAANALSGAAAQIAALETGPDLKAVTDATAIATRTAALERAMAEKGC